VKTDSGGAAAGGGGRFRARYETPAGLDDLWMESDGEALTGVWFGETRGKRPAAAGGGGAAVFRETVRWLDAYFAGHPPATPPRWRMEGLTPFRRDVLEAVLAIPYGATATYGEIAAAVARKRGAGKTSARAVGGAVGWNPLCILVPCHRVVGASGALVGYGGGLRNKAALLERERGGIRG